MSDMRATVVAMRADGLKPFAIAQQTGATVRDIYNWTCEARVAAGIPARRTKLPLRITQEILRQAKRGDAVKSIADDLNISMGAVAGHMAKFRARGLLKYRNEGHE